MGGALCPDCFRMRWSRGVKPLPPFWAVMLLPPVACIVFAARTLRHLRRNPSHSGRPLVIAALCLGALSMLTTAAGSWWLFNAPV